MIKQTQAIEIADKNEEVLRPAIKLALEKSNSNGDILVIARSGETEALLCWISLGGELWISNGIADKLAKLGLPSTPNGQLPIGNRASVSLERSKQ